MEDEKGDDKLDGPYEKWVYRCIEERVKVRRRIYTGDTKEETGGMVFIIYGERGLGGIRKEEVS